MEKLTKRKGSEKKIDTKTLFKFKSFSERIAGIKIDVSHKVHEDNDEEVEETYFNSALQKWRELDCTVHFVNFSREVTPLVTSLPQLVHHQLEVVEILKKHLLVPQSLAHEALLDIVVQLARDLQNDFYPHFKEFFFVITSLLKIHDATLIEQSFTTLAYLFKFLWRYLLKHIEDVFLYYSELLMDTQKPHIRQFAAESIGFLLRKVRNHDKLFHTMFMLVGQNPELSEGVGLVLFEMFKGVQQQFHSCTNKLLPVLLGWLGPVTTSESRHSTIDQFLVQQCVFQSLCVMMQSMVEHTRREYCTNIFTILQSQLELVYSRWRHESENTSIGSQLSCTLHLIGIWVSWKHGSRITNKPDLSKAIHPLMVESDLDEETEKTLLHLVASLLLVSSAVEMNTLFSVDDVFVTTRKPVIVLEFCKELFEWDGFNEVIMTKCLHYCEAVVKENEEHFDVILQFLCELVLRNHPMNEQFSSLEKLSLVSSHARTRGQCLQSFIMSQLCRVLDDAIRSLSVQSELHLHHHLWASLLCLRHYSPTPVSLPDHLQSLFSHLKQTTCTNTNNSDVHLLAHCLITMVMTYSPSDLIAHMPYDDIIDLLRHFPTDWSVLNAVLSYQLHTIGLNCYADKLEVVFPLLVHNLNSPYHKVRLVTLRILQLFEQPLMEELNIEEKDESTTNPVACDVITTCLNAEEIDLSLLEVRNKILQFQKLRYSPQWYNRVPSLYKEIPVRYLIGNLYSNLSILWDPVCEYISGYAVNSNKVLFWSIYGEMLEEISNYKPAFKPDKPVIPDKYASLYELYSCQQALAEWSVNDDRVDYNNFHLQLWKSMNKFPIMAEAKSRLIVPHALNFIYNQFAIGEDSLQTSQDLLKHTTSLDDNELTHNTCGGANDDNVDDKEDPELNTVIDRTVKPSHKTGRGINLKILKNMLQLFSAFKNPNSVYKQSDLYQLYLKLLTHRDTEIQKLSLTCILTYKSTSLVPYKEHLFGLLDDKTFREELSNFSFQSESCIVEDDHRSEVLSILVKLLYGHMMQSGHGPARGTAKKKIVLRFLSNCEGSIDELLALILVPFKQLLDHPVNNFSVDPSKVIPVKKQQGFLVQLSQLMSSFTLPQLFPHLPELLAVVIRLTLSAALLLDQHRQLIQPCYIATLKTIRQLSINCISECFTRYPDFDFTSFEADILTAAVWPQISKLPNECVQNPTPLLKFMFVWSKQPKLYHLFQQAPRNHDVIILGQVFQCLLTKGVNKSVTSIIMEMAYTFLGDSEGVGINLVLPHSKLIIKYLNTALKGSVKGCSLEMAVLSRMSQYISDSDTATQLVCLLVPFIQQSVLKSQDSQLHTLQSIEQLLRQVQNIQPFIRPMCTFFSILHARRSRKAVCDIFSTLSTKHECWKSAAEILQKINAWNPKSIDEPDYESILSGFAMAADMLDGLLADQLLPILHNAVFFLLQSTDMSIRDGAAGFVAKLVAAVDYREGERHLQDVLTGDALYARFFGAKYLVQCFMCPTFFIDKVKFKLLILDTLLGSIKQGLSSNAESAHHEFVAVLACLVKNHSSHSKFADMHQLLNDDPEQDFFENVKHIQLHRRTRALRHLSELCGAKSFSQSTMMDFLLPIASYVIFNSVTDREHNLVSEAINVLSTIAAQLKWTKYYFLLKSYLRLIPKKSNFQKNIIKTIVGILSGFHFDLTQVGGDEEEAMELGAQDEAGKDEEMPEFAEEMEDDNKSVQEEKAKALKIHNTIVKSLLPELHSCLTRKSNESGHRLSNHRHNSNDPDPVQVPVALAMTQLLLQLPEATLNANLPGLLLKICHTLRSYQRDVREVARGTLVKIANLLGSKYLHFIVREMKETLTKGYQVHVLSYSIHALLNGVKHELAAGDVDTCLQLVTEILMEDLFGSVAEERREGEIASKLPEARTSQSVKSYEIFTMFLSPSLLPQLLKPLKEVMDTQMNNRVFQTVEDVLKAIGMGLQLNIAFTTTHLLHFVHDLLSNNLPVFSTTHSLNKQAPPFAACRPPSIYLLSPEPTQHSHKPVTHSSRASVHIIAEFGLQLLLTSLKRGKVNSKNDEHLQMMDPFVELLTNLLTSKHPMVLTMVLRCITWMLRLPLPSLETHMKTISLHVFDVLRNHARPGANSSSNQKLVTSAFKAMTVLVRDCINQEITEAELKLLLTFIEEDIYDYQRQATAFPLLKAILGRKLLINQIYEIMNKVAQLSITSESENVQLQCRKAVLQFLLDYPLKKKLQSYLNLFISNLSYEVQSGRESVLEMLSVIFAKFPQMTLHKLAAFFFVPLASRLVNDDAPTCRSMVAEALKVLIVHVNTAKRNQLFSMVTIWIQNKQVMQQRLGIQLVGIFCEAEGPDFSKRVSSVLPLLSECLNMDDDEVKVKDDQSTSLDHLTFCILSTLDKLLNDDVIRNPNYSDQLMEIWTNVQQLLSHAHTWVQLTASKLFTQLFNTYKVSTKAITEPNSYLSIEPAKKISQLVFNFCGQLRSPDLTNELALQAVKNLVFLARLLPHIEDSDNGLSLSSLINKMLHIAAYEAGHYPKQSLKRSCVFKWIGAVAVELGVNLPNHLTQLLVPLYREESDSTNAAGEELHTLALEVIELLRAQVGREVFARAYASVQQEVQSKRLVRKRQRALEAVADPGKKALRKMRKNELKKASRRRRIIKHRPTARRITLGYQ